MRLSAVNYSQFCWNALDFSDQDRRHSGQVAQLVEQRTENPCVGGSNPPLPIIVNPWLAITYDCRPFFVMGQNGGCATGAQQILTQHLVGNCTGAVYEVSRNGKIKAVRRVETRVPR